MIPLRDTIRSRTVPFVNYALLGACGVVFLYELSLADAVDVFLRRYAVVPQDVHHMLRGGIPAVHPLLTLFTSQFLHGGWLHLIGNMLYLYIFGDNVEDRLGHGGYLLFYLASGAGAALVQVWSQPESAIPLIGASGAIAGVLGAYFLLYPRAKVLTLVPLFVFFPVVEIPAFVFIGFWFLIQFVNGGAAQATNAAGGVAWWAHAGGFVVGGVLLLMFILLGRLRRAVT